MKRREFITLRARYGGGAGAVEQTAVARVRHVYCPPYQPHHTLPVPCDAIAHAAIAGRGRAIPHQRLLGCGHLASRCARVARHREGLVRRSKATVARTASTRSPPAAMACASAA